MNFSKAINFLNDNGGPSIVFRTKKEILGQEFSKDEYEYYQNQIMQDEKVRYPISRLATMYANMKQMESMNFGIGEEKESLKMK